MQGIVVELETKNKKRDSDLFFVEYVICVANLRLATGNDKSTIQDACFLSSHVFNDAW